MPLAQEPCGFQACGFLELVMPVALLARFCLKAVQAEVVVQQALDMMPLPKVKPQVTVWPAGQGPPVLVIHS